MYQIGKHIRIKPELNGQYSWFRPEIFTVVGHGKNATGEKIYFTDIVFDCGNGVYQKEIHPSFITEDAECIKLDRKLKLSKLKFFYSKT